MLAQVRCDATSSSERAKGELRNESRDLEATSLGSATIGTAPIEQIITLTSFLGSAHLENGVPWAGILQLAARFGAEFLSCAVGPPWGIAAGR